VPHLYPFRQHPQLYSPAMCFTRLMKCFGIVSMGILACLLAVQTARAATPMRPVALPSSDGTVVGAAFSPDSSRLAIIRNVTGGGTSGHRHILQIVELKTAQEEAHADVLDGEASNLAARVHFLEYSPDGHYLLLATEASDALSIINATTLQTFRRIALHPEADSRMSLEQGHPYFRGVISLAVAGRGDAFGVLTHDEELQDNQVFVGSFSSARIIKSWSLGKVGTVTELGQTSISLSEDGLSTAVAVLSAGNTLPKGFNNLRLYNASSGEMLKSIPTNSFIGPIMLLPGENILASRNRCPWPFL
jgi:hypothetical protein